MKKIKLISGLISVSALLFFHLLFIAEKIYFYYWWSDIFMHFLGGFTLGLFVLILSSSKIFNLDIIQKKSFWLLVLIVVTGGIIWEIFEVYIGATFTLPRENYYVDTLADLLLDTVGAMFAVKIFTSRQKEDESNYGKNEN